MIWAPRARTESATRSLSGSVTWLDPAVRWAAGELAWAQQDWAAAESSFIEMKNLAIDVEHEPLACTAQLLLSQVFEAQGKREAALQEHRALRVRERRMASESLVGREAVVDWRLGARQSERHLKQALVVSKQFERWSLEDALTGIANRRCFEQSLEQRLQSPGAAARPLTVAMIDVDKFKSDPGHWRAGWRVDGRGVGGRPARRAEATHGRAGSTANPSRHRGREAGHR